MNKIDPRFTVQFIAQKDGQLLREALQEWRISKRALTAIKFDGGLLTVNGVERNVRYILQLGDCVEVTFPPEEKSDGLAVEHGDLTIVYEDEAILVVDKPAHQNTIPSREHPTGSIANMVCGHFQQQGLASTAHIVTRLDRDTSGLLCIAKHAHIHHLTGLAQRSREISRKYEAIVNGHVELKRFFLDSEPMTYIRLQLHTGRTHQIRVHMAYLGHPLVGDDLYGGSRRSIDRQALHCVSLDMAHPLTNEPLQFTSMLTNDILRLLG